MDVFSVCEQKKILGILKFNTYTYFNERTWFFLTDRLSFCNFFMTGTQHCCTAVFQMHDVFHLFRRKMYLNIFWTLKL